MRTVQEYDPGIFVSSLGRSHSLEEKEVKKYFHRLDELARKGNTLIYLVRQYPNDPLWTYWNKAKVAKGFE